MKSLLIGTAMLAMAATPAHAADKPVAPAKPVSPFVLCDGRTGYVSSGSRLFRALAVTATLGVSELATTKDDGSKRLSGAEGAAACTTALGLEQNGERRVELVIAKTIHLVEANKLDDALATIRTAAEAAGDYRNDIGFKRTLLPRAILLEAAVLLRAKQFEQAEDRAVEALQANPYDVVLAQRAQPFMLLTTRLTPAKRDALAQMVRIMPTNVGIYSDALTVAGRFDEAATVFADLIDVASVTYKKFSPVDFDAARCVLLVLSGNVEQSNQIKAKVETEIAALQASGDAGGMTNAIARASEMLTLQSLLVELKQGKATEARATFRAHGAWLLANRGIVYASMQQLQAGAPASELTGPLGESAAAWYVHKISDFATVWSTEEQTKRLYSLALNSASAEEYARAGRVTWATGPKPKFLLISKKSDEPARYEVMTTLSMASVAGLPAGEALLLQAALIARERKLDGFSLVPVRAAIDLIGVRFGNVGTPGFPANLSMSAQQVINDLSPVIPRPVAGK